LLSQVDASVGGKNGVNFDAYKNMIGQFNQPQFVLCDVSMLKSLPKKELLCGMAEILKHALIADAQMFETINQNWEQIQALEPKLMEDLVFNNIKIKAAIVEKDEREMGERKKLNFGHTLAHAIEKHADISHGEAVAIGIAFAARLSYQKQYLSKNALDSIITTINFLGLPEITNVEKSKLKSAILGDKKRERDSLTFVFLEAIGKARLEEIKIDELKHWIDDLC
jgi:3-dehydroquinate synthase